MSPSGAADLSPNCTSNKPTLNDTHGSCNKTEQASLMGYPVSCRSPIAVWLRSIITTRIPRPIEMVQRSGYLTAKDRPYHMVGPGTSCHQSCTPPTANQGCKRVTLLVSPAAI
ncbi:hypothetical protein DSO57_1037326 [Entomophthora muscae]|uniref:Uncharacterized protein n=1 Tax=Entomophthora muscae TaxID=34485 RepID=A0ACC2U8I9_9FUNG|nr:hypothetical protein DSO57_1037326 [Entomophthora muscae]